MRYNAVVFAVLFVPALAWAEPPAVAVLLEDDADGLLAQLSMGGISGGEQNRADVETEDVFSGKAAVRVAAAQRFHPDLKGWDFAIAEKPKPGEYRYLRFAWKKGAPGGPLMLQFHTRKPGQDWFIRYWMGPNGPPWESKTLADAAPVHWVVVTRDLFKDFGAITLGGMALTPLEGGDGLFDHILLGRTIDDLDQATARTLLKTPPKEPLSSERLKRLWDELGSGDEIKGTTALWALVRGHKEAVPFLDKATLAPVRPVRKVDAEAVKPLMEQLVHYRHVTRAAAADELVRLGDGVLPHLRTAAAAAEGERKARLTALLDGWADRNGFNDLRLLRAAAVLSAVGTPEARTVLEKIKKSLPD